MRVACQTYTWEMLGDAWRGRVTDLLDGIAAAGYEGLEITNHMIREFAHQPREFLGELSRRSMKLAAFAYSSASGFSDPGQLKRDLDGADAAIRFASHFPGAQLALGGAASADDGDRRAKLDHAIAFYNEVGRRAHESGLVAHVHPHSHHGSLLETAEEYEYLQDRLDPDSLRFGPDTGHIVRGGQELAACLGKYAQRISHIHLKDVDAQGCWQPLGEGMIDFPAALALLQCAGYEGWLVCEEESEAARCGGVAATRKNRDYLRSLGH